MGHGQRVSVFIEVATGTVGVANCGMAEGLPIVSVKRWDDAREFSLVAFVGAGFDPRPGPHNRRAHCAIVAAGVRTLAANSPADGGSHGRWIIDVVEVTGRIVARFVLPGGFADITDGSGDPLHHERSTLTSSPRTCSSNDSTSKIAPSRSIGSVPESAPT